MWAECGHGHARAPRDRRPDSRRWSHPQKEIAETEGVSVGTVNGDLKFSSENGRKPLQDNMRGNISDFEESGGVAFETRPFETAGGTQAIVTPGADGEPMIV